MGIWVQEEGINRTENYTIYGGFDVTFDSGCDVPGEVFKQIAKSGEYGRCTGKIYIDTTNGPKHIGWVFEKRVKYNYSKETFLKETWITLHTHAPRTSMGSPVEAS